MAVWLLIQLSAILGVFAQQNVQNPAPHSYLADLETQLQEAAYAVLQQESWSSYDFPEFNMPKDFMHSFIPGTGVGNREDLVIDVFRSTPVYYDMSFSKWRYERFNNSDYVLGIHHDHVALWRTSLTDKKPFHFASSDLMFLYSVEDGNIVLDAILFPRYWNHLQILYVAVLTRTHKTDLINIYEIIATRGMLMTVIDLGLKVSSEASSKNKLAYVQSQHEGSLVVLVDRYGENKIIYQKKGSSTLSHYIEVHCQSPVDLITFSINGHGYIAVANRTVAEVFKMDDFLQDHIPFEWFPYMENIVDLEYFRLGFHHYLAIAAENYQTLSVWNRGGFFLKQEFNFPDAQQWYSALLPTCRDDIILLLIQKHSSEMFVWNGQTESFAQVPHVIPSDFKSMAGSITSFSYNTTAFLLLVKDEDITQLFSIETHLKSVSDPVLISGKEVSEVMKKLQDMLEKQEEQIRQISSILVNVVRQHGNQTLTVSQSFTDLQISDGLSSELVITYENMKWKNSPLTMEEFNQGTTEMEAKIRDLEDRVKSIEETVQDVVLLNESAVITGSTKIAGNVYVNSLKVNSLNIESALGMDIRRVQNEIYRLDRPQLINGIMNFNKLTVAGDMDVKSQVNGIDFSEDLMTTNSNQVSEAFMTFDETLYVLGNVNLSGTLNNIDIGREVVTVHGNHVISGKKSFPDGIVAENVETKLLDGIDVVDLNRRALKLTGDQIISGEMIFSGTLYALEIKATGLINGYNILEVANELVMINKLADIVGAKFFNDINLRGDLVVGGLIKDLLLPDDLLIPDKEQVITGKKTFTGRVSADNVMVKGTVDGLSLPSDIISLTGDEEVETTLYFLNGITVRNDVIVHGLVDGVDISDLTIRALNHQNSSRLNATFSGPLTILESVTVEGNINDVPLKEMIKDLVFKDDRNVIFSAPKKFATVTAGSVAVRNKVNGYNLSEDFMLSHGNQLIKGMKTFRMPVTFHDINTDKGYISGVNFEELYENRIRLSIKDGYETLDFDHLVIDKNLTVQSLFNGLQFPGDAVRKSVEQTIYNKRFGDLHFDNLKVDGIIVPGTFSGVRLQDFYDQRATLKGNEDIHGDIVLGNTTAFSVKVSGLVNDLDIVEFAENVMSLTKNQTVTAFKDFSGNVSAFADVETREGINGIKLGEVKERAFKLHETNVVTAPVTFQDPLMVENISVEGNMNGLDFDELADDSVRTYGVQHITSETVFLKGFNVDGDIQADEVNGFDVSTDVLTKHTSQVITGRYTFGAVTVGGNVEVGGQVNGMDLFEVDQQLAKRNLHNIITSDLTFKKPVAILHDLNVAGLINGKDSQHLKEAFILETGDQHMTGEKTLKGSVTIYGDINPTTINGENWIDFLTDVARIDIPQNIPAPKTFLSDLEVKGDIFVSNKASVGLVNGIDLEKFMQEAVLTDKTVNITGEKIFSSPVEISGELTAELINGLNLKRDVITSQCVDEDTQVITGSKTFQNLTVMGNVIVEQLVNGHKLKDLFRDTLTTDGNQTVTGQKNFKERITAEDIHANNVNGLNLKDFVTRHSTQIVNASMTFTDDMHVAGDLTISGTVNGVDLNVLSNILYTDGDQTITGPYVIDMAKAESNVTVKGTINDLILHKFFPSVRQFYEDTLSRKNTFVEISKQQCQATEYLHSVAEDAYYALDGFETYQVLNFSADFIETSPSDDLILIQTLDEDSSVTAVSYSYDSSKDQFVFADEYLTRAVKTKLYHFGNTRLTISIGAQIKESFVSYGSETFVGIKEFDDGAAVILKDKVYLAILYATTGYCDMYTISNLHSYPSILSAGSLFVGKETKAIAVFEIWGNVYVAFSRKFDFPSSKESSLVFVWKDGWKLAQEIPAAASSEVIHFKYYEHDYLIFTNSRPVHETLDPMYIQVYRYTEQGYPFKLYQKIPFDNAKGLQVFKLGNLPDLYLTTFNETRVRVYRLDGEAGFMSNITLRGKCITAVKAVVVQHKLFVVVSQHDKNYVEASMSVIYKGIEQGSAVLKKELKHC